MGGHIYSDGMVIAFNRGCRRDLWNGLSFEVSRGSPKIGLGSCGLSFSVSSFSVEPERARFKFSRKVVEDVNTFDWGELREASRVLRLASLWSNDLDRSNYC